MIRTIIALPRGDLAKSVSQTLAHRGITVRYHCANGAEVIRAVKEMGGGVVICPFKLRDMTVLDLAERLEGLAYFLVLGKGSTLSLCDREDLFTMTVPIRASELAGAVAMLLQLDSRRAASTIPRRSDDAQALIDEAKALLMARKGLTEPQAHRYLQQRSMRAGARMEETARAVLDEEK